jgi:hypothetical protein
MRNNDATVPADSAAILQLGVTHPENLQHLRLF